MFSKVSMVTPTLLPPFPQICHFACLQAKSSLTNPNLYVCIICLYVCIVCLVNRVES